MADTKTLEASCYCKAVHFTIAVPLESLPLAVHLCHCSICRYRSGAPCVFHARLQKEWSLEFVAPSTERNITQYDIPGTKSSWHFCSTCGCHVGSKMYSDGRWVISSSIFLDHGKDNFLIRKHIHSGSTKDGGLAACMERVIGREQPDDGRDSTEGRVLEDWHPDEAAEVSEPEFDSGGRQRLRAQCHCGGVSFTIGRPTEEHMNDSFHRQYLSPLDQSKWFATWDVCNDCRLVHGNHVIGWTFIPVSSIDKPIKKDLAIGTSKTFESSPGVRRSFCGTCGATVFFSCDDRCPTEEKQVVDIATGILRAPGGTNATDWLTWRPRLAHSSSGYQFDPQFCRNLEEGMKQWTAREYSMLEDFAEKLNRDI